MELLLIVFIKFNALDKDNFNYLLQSEDLSYNIAYNSKTNLGKIGDKIKIMAVMECESVLDNKKICTASNIKVIK